MSDETNKPATVLSRVQKLPENTSREIETAARELESYNYSPTLIFPLPGFIRFTKTDLKNEVTRLFESETNETSDKTELIRKQINLLLYHYELLVRLRKGDPEAWDEITELYDDD
jgi:hypothetical protein